MTLNRQFPENDMDFSKNLLQMQEKVQLLQLLQNLYLCVLLSSFISFFSIIDSLVLSLDSSWEGSRPAVPFWA